MGYTGVQALFGNYNCDYLCTGLTDLLQICGYNREKAGFSLPYKVYGAESAFLILISDPFEPLASLPHREPGDEATGPPSICIFAN